MHERIAVIGIGAVPIGKYKDVLDHELLLEALALAFEDAGVQKEDIGGLVFSHPRTYTKQRYFATFMAGHLRVQSAATVMEVVGDGMTGGFAFDKAVDEILLGKCNVCVALGVSMETQVPSAEHMDLTMRAVGDVDFQAPFGFTPISWYAMDAVRYMHEHGATRTQLASVAVKNRRHASLNPIAQYKDELTLEEVLNARPIVEPLGLLEVPPRSDGAVAVILSDLETAEKLGKPYVVVRGRGFFHEGAHQISDKPSSMIRLEAARQASRLAYEDAAISAEDIDVAELYAPCTIVEVLVSEALGLCPEGQGAMWAERGETALGGSIPLCTSGGLLSRGHPPLVTPLYNVVEVVQQLRGEAAGRQVRDAEFALTSAELGNYNAALVHVFGKGG
ncbi:MAG: Acetyl-CoA C-acyltransferase [uncultured Rubrobacteraceae bacterium]|uniref:Acetyl-CoA C-acyltransferase n=1 Tax=uncultured Rubrobacteraceae bacterium TaxID=349277 RepID=A0A6J4QH53_9ACTN|nr:MAG: Acetyl-CoA C-acyltransferase [uncultured Rubrobacteraceae bacterium]